MKLRVRPGRRWQSDPSSEVTGSAQTLPMLQRGSYDKRCGALFSNARSSTRLSTESACSSVQTPD